MIEFKNESKLIFTDISSEQYREYIYPDSHVRRYDSPLQLNVSPNGHRLFLADGRCVYVTKGWESIVWEVKEGAPHFVK
jgi:hypothetical protein